MRLRRADRKYQPFWRPTFSGIPAATEALKATAERCSSRPVLPGDEIPPQCDLLAGHPGKHEFVDRFLGPAHVEYVLQWPR